jgi:hypothetical protein
VSTTNPANHESIDVCEPLSECGSSTCCPSNFLPLNEASNIRSFATKEEPGASNAKLFVTEEDFEIFEVCVTWKNSGTSVGPS